MDGVLILFLLFLVSKASFQCRIFSVLHQTLQPMPHAIPSRVSKVITQTPWTIAMVPACSGNLRPAIRGVFLQKPLEAAGDNSAKDIRSRSCRDCRAQDMTRSWAGFISRLTWGADLKWFEACIRRTSWDRFLLFVIFRPPAVTFWSFWSFCYVCWINSSRILQQGPAHSISCRWLGWRADSSDSYGSGTRGHSSIWKHITPHARLIMTYLYCLY